jgi:hypothetical protein
VVAWAGEAIVAQRPALVAGFGLDPGDLGRGHFLFAFEPDVFGAAAGYVVARSLPTTRRPR